VQGPGGTWIRDGAYLTAVNDDSTLLQLPDSLEEKIPLEANHSELVKFMTQGSRKYDQVRRRVTQLLEEAPEAVQKRFCRCCNVISLLYLRLI
jgi:hypothetical protein